MNRVGTEHQQVHIFNFFPTAQGEAELGLEDNIKTKIQAFHDMMGEDAKYLTDDEEVTQHGFFGDRLYRHLSDPSSYVAEEEERSELEFLQVIRDIRDRQPELYEEVKRLPKKARSARHIAIRTAEPSVQHAPEELISFFRRGKLKKFYLAGNETPFEINFMEAADMLRCTPGTQRMPIPPAYYERLSQNRNLFALDTAPDQEETVRRGSRSNVAQVTKYLKSIRRFPKFTDADERYVVRVMDALDAGIVPENTLKRLRQDLFKTTDALKALAILRQNISVTWLDAAHIANDVTLAPVEVILSEYMYVNTVADMPANADV